jgi:hypothetical protein
LTDVIGLGAVADAAIGAESGGGADVADKGGGAGAVADTLILTPLPAAAVAAVIGCAIAGVAAMGAGVGSGATSGAG